MTHSPEHGQAPRQVALYANQPDPPVRAAVFRSDGATVTLEVLDPKWGRLAERLMQRGIYRRADGVRVTPEEADNFMTLPARGSRATYFGFVAEPPSEGVPTPELPSSPLVL